MKNHEVIVLGAGAAGATIARMLARWGHSVLLYAKPDSRPARAESLPPSTRNLFELLEIRDRIGAAGFFRDGGNTSWWTSEIPREENFASGALGWHVDRRRFDRLLVDLAVEAGVTVTSEDPAHRSRRFTVDASGRLGLIGREVRVADRRYRTVSIGCEWTGEWDVEPTHALVEAYEDGWAWSVPIDGNQRHLAFMVDHGQSRGGAQQAYEAELGKTRVLRKIFEGSKRSGTPWAADASIYRSSKYATSEWLLCGDAGSTVDPLSSFGVKKALISAWMGAVVVNTCLSRPELAEAAVQLFNMREEQTFADNARQSAIQFGELVPRFGTEFWKARSVLPADLRLYEPEALQQAYDDLKARESVRLKLSSPLRMQSVPSIAGREIVMLDRLVLEGVPPTIEYIQGVNLIELARIAEDHRQVPDLFEAYNDVAKPVALSNFIAALSFLIANRVITIE